MKFSLAILILLTIFKKNENCISMLVFIVAFLAKTLLLRLIRKRALGTREPNIGWGQAKTGMKCGN